MGVTGTPTSFSRPKWTATQETHMQQLATSSLNEFIDGCNLTSGGWTLNGCSHQVPLLVRNEAPHALASSVQLAGTIDEIVHIFKRFQPFQPFDAKESACVGYLGSKSNHQHIAIQWMRLDPPPLTRDRDACILDTRNVFSRDGKRGYACHFQSVDIPECPNLEVSHRYVRASIQHSGYVFTEIHPGLVNVVLSLHVDFGGRFPICLAHHYLKKQVATIKSLEMYIRQVRIQDAALLYPVQPHKQCPCCRKVFGVFERSKTCAGCDEVVCVDCSSVGLVHGRKVVPLCIPCVLVSVSKPSTSSLGVLRAQIERHISSVDYPDDEPEGKCVDLTHVQSFGPATRSNMSIMRSLEETQATSEDIEFDTPQLAPPIPVARGRSENSSGLWEDAIWITSAGLTASVAGNQDEVSVPVASTHDNGSRDEMHGDEGSESDTRCNLKKGHLAKVPDDEEVIAISIARVELPGQASREDLAICPDVEHTVLDPSMDQRTEVQGLSTGTSGGVEKGHSVGDADVQGNVAAAVATIELCVKSSDEDLATAPNDNMKKCALDASMDRGGGDQGIIPDASGTMEEPGFNASENAKVLAPGMSNIFATISAVCPNIGKCMSTETFDTRLDQSTEKLELTSDSSGSVTKYHVAGTPNDDAVIDPKVATIEHCVKTSDKVVPTCRSAAMANDEFGTPIYQNNGDQALAPEAIGAVDKADASNTSELEGVVLNAEGLGTLVDRGTDDPVIATESSAGVETEPATANFDYENGIDVTVSTVESCSPSCGSSHDDDMGPSQVLSTSVSALSTSEYVKTRQSIPPEGNAPTDRVVYGLAATSSISTAGNGQVVSTPNDLEATSELTSMSGGKTFAVVPKSLPGEPVGNEYVENRLVTGHFSPAAVTMDNNLTLRVSVGNGKGDASSTDEGVRAIAVEMTSPCLEAVDECQALRQPYDKDSGGLPTGYLLTPLEERLPTESCVAAEKSAQVDDSSNVQENAKGSDMLLIFRFITHQI
ncbi:hypothetical protein DYB30_005628 [Aphanomyces astaci]|uniref:START domain-containing protein n=1 Tax=Aphanomyces astaci TaxID=112090 RepID=A0A397DR33_APHAT|nr:hypothetical protein DYB30_005628 [Aphanomyces astaci]